MSNKDKEKLLAAGVLTGVIFLFATMVFHSVAISMLLVGIGAFLVLAVATSMVRG